MKKINKEDRKILSKFLNEEWHEYIISREKLSTCSCGMTGYIVREYCASANRSFTTPDHMFAIKDELVRKKLFHKFYIFSVKYWGRDPRDAEYYDWIFNVQTFNKIAAKFLSETN